MRCRQGREAGLEGYREHQPRSGPGYRGHSAMAARPPMTMHDIPDATSRRMSGIRMHRTALRCTSSHRFQAAAISTQISTQRRSAVEPGCYIPWSRRQTGAAFEKV